MFDMTVSLYLFRDDDVLLQHSLCFRVRYGLQQTPLMSINSIFFFADRDGLSILKEYNRCGEEVRSAVRTISKLCEKIPYRFASR